MPNDDVTPTVDENNEATAAAVGGDGLNRESLETIREMSNIFIGAAAASLSSLLNTDIDAPTPEVSQHDNQASWSEPFVGSGKILMRLRFSHGLEYHSGFLLKTRDAKTIANMMLGNGSGETNDEPLNDLESSAVSEAMSQMMNAAASSLSSIIGEAIDVDSPVLKEFSTDALSELFPAFQNDAFVNVQFELKLGDGSSIPMIQLISSTEASQQVSKLMNVKPDKGLSAPGASDSPTASDTDKDLFDSFPNDEELEAMAAAAMPSSNASAATAAASPVTVQPVQFTAFDEQPSIYGDLNKNLGLVMDVTLNLTVELGKTEISIKEVLELTRGSVIELNRIAGEPVDLLANGKLIAKGEVVVIEDNFGLRITSIVAPADRLRGLQG